MHGSLSVGVAFLLIFCIYFAANAVILGMLLRITTALLCEVRPGGRLKAA